MYFPIPNNIESYSTHQEGVSAGTIQEKPWLHLEPIAYCLGTSYGAAVKYLRAECPAAGLSFVKFWGRNGNHFVLSVDEVALRLVIDRFTSPDDDSIRSFVQWLTSDVLARLQNGGDCELQALRGDIIRPISAFFGRNTGPRPKDPPLENLPISVPFTTPVGRFAGGSLVTPRRFEDGAVLYGIAIEFDLSEAPEIDRMLKGGAAALLGDRRAQHARVPLFRTVVGGRPHLIAEATSRPLIFGANGENLTGQAKVRLGAAIRISGTLNRLVVPGIWETYEATATLEAVQLLEAPPSITNPFATS